jgi:hypothetical protein
VNLWPKYVLVSLLVAAAPSFSIAQQTGAQPPVKGMASTVGLFVYPQKNQSATQQLTDEQQCYNSAKTQTGYDPNSAAPAAKTKDQKSGESGDDDHAAAKRSSAGRNDVRRYRRRCCGGSQARGNYRGHAIQTRTKKGHQINGTNRYEKDSAGQKDG